MESRSINSLVHDLCDRWSEPRVPQYMIDANASLMMPMRCWSQDRVSDIDVDGLPSDLAQFWTHFEDACLFYDVNYGQWGLKLLSFAESKFETKSFFATHRLGALAGDTVFGMFVGDLELLVIRTDSQADDFGKLIVALPASPRSEWYYPADSLSDFFVKYVQADGQKYWEPQFDAS